MTSTDTFADPIVTETGHTKGQLSAAFDALIEEDAHWKDPIGAVIAEDDYGSDAEAVKFFTATKLEITGRQHSRRLVMVKAKGYRAGPAGDH